MKRNSFTDCDGNKGVVGSRVIQIYLGKEYGEIEIVKDIISKGAGGTRIYFEKGYGNAKNFRVVNE